MTEPSTDVADPFELARFVAAQHSTFERAMSEVKAGRKQSHWMWYIYPQLRGLGSSSNAQRYGIASAAEAAAYLAHDLLGPRLIVMCEAALSVEGRSATDIFGKPDDLKLRSCATLFAHVSGAEAVFQKIIDKYFDGQTDPGTVQLLSDQPHSPAV